VCVCVCVCVCMCVCVCVCVHACVLGERRGRGGIEYIMSGLLEHISCIHYYTKETQTAD